MRDLQEGYLPGAYSLLGKPIFNEFHLSKGKGCLFDLLAHLLFSLLPVHAQNDSRYTMESCKLALLVEQSMVQPEL